ncbi:hypothetical protein GNI_092860 [Gregarina niphandrodes]|uniref:Uncharacterized protein n=1 Tax=Gregarina niphandrodes TaxID=110365 RepID=A0A023B586_GRENI|nr:hypothetical protein GNI_092860 [Gregarina niphandrodes]EZG59142.1 hypothetical protein GNI_092860 [Gregarina niphandrodes]|eukprot:XP_011130902.1 hypothetical protein GNI_092860 [Gregarina niphandrodes]
MNYGALARHFGPDMAEKLPMLLFQEVQEEGGCINGVMLVGRRMAFVSRSVDMSRPKLRRLSSLFSLREVHLRQAVIPVLDALGEKFRNTSVYGLKLSLEDISECLGDSTELPTDDETVMDNRHDLDRHDLDRHDWDRHDLDRHDWDRRDLDRHDLDRHDWDRHDWDRHDRDRHDWDGSEFFGHGEVLCDLPNHALLHKLRHEYRAFAVGLALLSLYSNVPNCKDGYSFKIIVCNFLAKLHCKIRRENEAGLQREICSNLNPEDQHSILAASEPSSMMSETCSMMSEPSSVMSETCSMMSETSSKTKSAEDYIQRLKSMLRSAAAHKLVLGIIRNKARDMKRNW